MSVVKQSPLRCLLFVPSMACFLQVPPEAPSELEELCKYLFAHLADEDPEALQMGLSNLDTWMYTDDNLQQTLEGYQVHNLDDDSVAELDDIERSIRSNLIGAALGYKHDHSMTDLVQTMFVDDWSAVSDGLYEAYDRQFSEPPSCLVNRECIWNTYETDSISNYIIVKVDGITTGQVRWVETPYGWALVQRTWLKEPAEVTPDAYDITLYSQYFLNVTAPTRDGDILRTTASWIDSEYGVIPITEDYAKVMIIDNMKKQNEDIIEWIEMQ